MSLHFRVAGWPAARASSRAGRREIVIDVDDNAALHDAFAVAGRDVVLLTIAAGPTLVLHPAHARDLLRAQRAGPSARTALRSVDVGARLHWASLPRSARSVADPHGSATLQRFEIATLAEATAGVAAMTLAKRLDEQCGNGLFQLSPEAPLRPLKGRRPIDSTQVDVRGALLVLVHGTFVETSSTFGKLWSEHGDLVQRLFAHYRGRVLAFDHPTLRTGPVANALALARALPAGAHLHLLAHSRGGLVADVLARAGDAGAARRPFEDEDFRKLVETLRERSIRIERVVRVACPAHGTLLASRRLDACLSVLRWTLDLAAIPVAPTFVAFLAAVARQRLDPSRLPGLAAMVPGSALVHWLNQGSAVDGDLRVLAGDVEGDSLASWLATLVADTYFRVDNDFVVQTQSMYGGARRREPAAYRLERGREVTHVGYFAHRPSAQAIVDALLEDAPQGFRTIGPRSAAGESASGFRAVASRARGRSRPAVVVVADIFGSELAGPLDDPRAWAASGALQPVALDATRYGELLRFLAESHDVIPVPCDWRLPIERQARALANAFDARLDDSKTAVRVLAHGAGGLVARAIARVKPRTWRRLADRAGFRLVMLGTPQDGEGLPMQLLSGRIPIGPLVGSDPRIDEPTLRGIAAQWPGLLGLQAGLDDGLARAATWRELAREDVEAVASAAIWHDASEQVRRHAWGLPSQATLDRAAAFRDRLDAASLAHAAIVAGAAPFAVDAIGDGRVTLASALLPNVPAWRAAADHDGLVTTPALFPALLDLLCDGTTGRIETVETTPSRAADPDPPLAITVRHGDLAFAREPLLVGHYRSLRLAGTERIVDRLLDGRLQAALDAGAYPDAPRTSSIFGSRNDARWTQPEAIVVVGLGDEGTLRPGDLVASVRHGTLAWLERAGKRNEATLAATLVGSGGTRLSAGQSAQLVAQGVVEANRASAASGARVHHLVLTELFAERASDAWRALRAAALVRPGEFTLGDSVPMAFGAMPGPLQAGYRGADYDFVSATTQVASDGEATIVYAIDTRRARTEIVSQAPQAALVRPLIRDALRATNADRTLGRSLFALLVPRELEPLLAGSVELVLELDAGTAGIPWEFLDAGTNTDAEPWAVRTRLVRKLRTPAVAAQPQDVARDVSALVIGDPLTDPSPFEALPAARAEASAVARRLARAIPADALQALFASSRARRRPEGRTIVGALLARPWSIVHVAGHGTDDGAGIVLSDGAVLGAHEFASLRTVPELVFVNACHSAALARRPLDATPPPSERAATLAGELIALGVRCVVAAGWAVDDDAARVFAGRFYDSLLLSRRFIDAVADARHATWKRGGTTWAAYQCYGDPDWTLRRDVRAPPASAEDIAAEFVDIATAAELAIALDSIAIRSRAPFADIALERARLSHLQARFELRWPDRGDVLAASARAHEALGDVDGASKRRARALAATNGEAPRDPPAFDAIAQRIVEASDRGTLGVQRTALLDDIHALAKRHPSPAAWQRLHARMRASLRAGADARTLLRAIEAVAR